MVSASRQSMTAFEWLLLVVLSILWGGSFAFNAILVAAWPPFTIVFGRVFLAALLLLAAARRAGHAIPNSAAAWWALAGMAVLNNLVPFTLIVWGQRHVPSGLAAILNATTPLFAAVLAHVLTRDEPLTPNRLAGVLLGILGVGVMVGPAALQGFGGDVLGQLAVLGAAFSYGLSSVYARRFRTIGLTPLAIAAGQVTCTAVLTLPIMLVVDRPWTLASPDAGMLLSLLGLAVLSTALGYILFFRILTGAGATNATLVTLLIPVSAVLLGAAFLDERLEARQFGGMALIMAGLASTDGRLPLWFAKRLGLAGRTAPSQPR